MVGATPVDVSVIVAVRNGAETLSQCIDSVLEQVGCTVELIVVDGMSTDATPDIVAAYGNRVGHFIREPDTGIYDAWNKALRVADGEWCAFLGADDYFLGSGSVATLLESVRRNRTGPLLVYGGVRRVGAAEDYVIHPDPPDVLRFLLSGGMIPPPGALHRVGSLRDIGGFDSTHQICGDLAAVLALAGRGPILRCSHVVTAMRVGGISSDWASQRRRHTERRKILSAEIGALRAAAVIWRSIIPQYLGYAIEVALRCFLGRRYGTRATLALRRCFGAAPKLNSGTGSGP